MSNFKKEDSIAKKIFALNDKTNAYIEKMACAYLRETNIPASEAELVQQINLRGDITWYFRRRRSGEIGHQGDNHGS